MADTDSTSPDDHDVHLFGRRGVATFVPRIPPCLAPPQFSTEDAAKLVLNRLRLIAIDVNEYYDLWRSTHFEPFVEPDGAFNDYDAIRACKRLLGTIDLAVTMVRGRRLLAEDARRKAEREVRHAEREARRITREARKQENTHGRS